jgi:hypothetical protein
MRKRLSPNGLRPPARSADSKATGQAGLWLIKSEDKALALLDLIKNSLTIATISGLQNARATGKLRSRLRKRILQPSVSQT